MSVLSIRSYSVAAVLGAAAVAAFTILMGAGYLPALTTNANLESAWVELIADIRML